VLEENRLPYNLDVYCVGWDVKTLLNPISSLKRTVETRVRQNEM